MTEWKTDDWAIFDLSIGQITIREDGFSEFSDGMLRTSGSLTERFRPLTLHGKRVVERMKYWYDELHKIDGEAGFNYPHIHWYYCQLALAAIDDKDAEWPYDKAREFVQLAQKYTPEIDGVKLFRRKLRA